MSQSSARVLPCWRRPCAAKVRAESGRLIFGRGDFAVVTPSAIETEPRISVAAQQILHRFCVRLRQERCTKVGCANGVGFFQDKVATSFVSSHGHRKCETEQQREHPQDRALNATDLTFNGSSFATNSRSPERNPTSPSASNNIPTTMRISHWFRKMRLEFRPECSRSNRELTRRGG